VVRGRVCGEGKSVWCGEGGVCSEGRVCESMVRVGVWASGGVRERSVKCVVIQGGWRMCGVGKE